MEKIRKDAREANWYAHVAFALATGALALALIVSGTSVYVARRDSQHARTLAKAVEKRAAEKRAILHRQDLKSCESTHANAQTTHVIARTFITYLAASNARNERLLRDPAAFRGLSPELVRSTRAAVAATRKLLADLKAADTKVVDCDVTDPRDVLPLKGG